MLGFVGAALLAAPAALAADTYKLDPVHSHANFKILHLNTGYQHGRFNDLEGTVWVDEKNPANSKVEVTIKADSIDTKNAKRDEHLRSPDFFNAKQFPTLSFKSTKVEAAGAGKYKVSGNLTMHGVTKPVSFVLTKTGEGKDPWGNFRMGGEAIFTINRFDYGINYMPDGLGKDVTLMLTFEGVKQ
ncbi:MAG: polyisoprenoid-binding protein [Candidatus Melainabacteria bacterium HGW-Melainabacteria-1]|nr:MAG: polyisoprenoid-binding protein [Candidatus Melainabacteria bacterium HGW-Melainabacteria-1]